MVVYMNYGKTLKSLRTYDLVTQEEIAKKLGISKKTYGLYETQEKIIPLKYLNTISNLYNVSIDYLLGLSNIRKYVNSKQEINKKLFSKRLKLLRKKYNITQQYLAEKINAHHSTICNYENGKNLITTAFLYDICKNFHISADYLLGKIDS